MSAFTAERWQEVGRLFNELVVLSPEEQASRLEQIGATDSDLRKAIESLLSADASAEERLERFNFGVADLLRQKVAAAASNSRDPLSLIGKAVSHFRVVDYLASGGMGVVYRADDTQLSRNVALKFPLPDTHLDMSVKERFIREAKTIASLDHANLCAVYEAGESEHGLFLAMPLYSGETLKQRLAATAPLSVEESLRIARQVASGLEGAHAAGVIHRDLKPGNIMLLPDGTVKILDFGLAKVSDRSETKSGVGIGTVSYMSPEQIRGTSVGPKTDLWSLGVLLYEMVTGFRPFSGEHEISIAHAILNDEPKPPSSLRRSLPAGVQHLALALLQKDPDDRYPNPTALINDIDAIQRGDTPAFRSRHRSRPTIWLRKRRTTAAVLGTILFMTTAAAIAPRLLAAFSKKPTRNAEAYRLYLRGREYEQRGPRAAAESLYHRALALDSSFALARARLAVVYAGCRAGGSRDCYRASLEDRAVARVEEIRTEAEHALKQQPDMADAHLAMGLYWEQRENYLNALREYERARSGLEKSGELHAAIGRSYRALGRWDEAIRELERAIAIDPQDATSTADLATTFSRLRRYPESIRRWNEYLTLVPDAYAGMIIKGNVYLRWLGTVDSLANIFEQLPVDWQKRSVNTRVLIARIRKQPKEALTALDESPQRQDRESYGTRLLRAQVYQDLGDSARARIFFDSARVILEKTRVRDERDFQRHIALGLAHAGLGRHDDARREANRAMEVMPPSRTVPAGTTAMRGAAEIFAQIPEFHTAAVNILDQLMQMPAGREASIPLLRVDPAWNSLRGDLAFQQFLAKYSAR